MNTTHNIADFMLMAEDSSGSEPEKLSNTRSLISFFVMPFSIFLKFFIFPLFMICIAIYSILFSIHFFIPNSSKFESMIIDDESTSTFSSSIQNYVISYFETDGDTPQGFAPDAIFLWVRSCPVLQQSLPVSVSTLPIGAAGISFWGPNLPPLLSLINTQGGRLRQQITDSRQELLDLRTRAYVFLTLSAIIGFFTTVVAATNAWYKTDTAWGGVFRLLGVVLPALGTLAAALASIYAPVDTVSRKAQLVSGLISLQGELSAMLAETTCDKVKNGDTDLSKNFADWNKRFSSAVATAEFSQGPTTTTPRDPGSEQKKTNSSESKTAQDTPVNLPPATGTNAPTP